MDKPVRDKQVVSGNIKVLDNSVNQYSENNSCLLLYSEHLTFKGEVGKTQARCMNSSPVTLWTVPTHSHPQLVTYWHMDKVQLNYQLLELQKDKL